MEGHNPTNLPLCRQASSLCKGFPVSDSLCVLCSGLAGIHMEERSIKGTCNQGTKGGLLVKCMALKHSGEA